MITYKWTCACAITIETSSEKQLEMAMKRHYNKHAKSAGWNKDD